MTEYIFGFHSVLTMLEKKSSFIQEILLNIKREDQRAQKIQALAAQKNISVKIVNKEALDTLCHNNNHQGFVAVCSQAKSLGENQLDELIDQNISPKLILILDGIQDPHNLGACLRSADAVGVNLVIIPKDKACEITPLVRKTACGAVENLSIMTVVNLKRVIETLKKKNFWIYGLDGTAETSIYETKFDANTALVLGSEGQGLRRLTKESCDFLINIPMRGHVESLNVSVACGISLFEAMRQHGIYSVSSKNS